MSKLVFWKLAKS